MKNSLHAHDRFTGEERNGNGPKSSERKKKGAETRMLSKNTPEEWLDGRVEALLNYSFATFSKNRIKLLIRIPECDTTYSRYGCKGHVNKSSESARKE